MIFKKFDLLSSKVTLFYDGDLRHKSIASGLLTVIAYMGIIIILFIYLEVLLKRENQTMIYYQKFEKDIGSWKTSNQIFHYISFGTQEKIDFKAVQIIGTQMIAQAFVSLNLENNPKILFGIPHWLYEACDESDYRIHQNTISNKEEYFRSACLKKYWNPGLRKYVTQNEPGFVHPEVAHGGSSNNDVTYNTIIRFCQEETIIPSGGEINPEKKCYSSEKEILDYLSKNKEITFNFVDHYADISNYHKPEVSFINSIQGNIETSVFFVNNLNFKPMDITTHKSLLFDSTENIRSYYYTSMSKVGQAKPEHSTILASYQIHFENNVSLNERKYMKIPEALAEIGGKNNKFIFI